MKTKRFDKEIADQLGHYVYLLIDKTNGEIFYVGKGQGNRIFQHELQALKADLDEDKIDDKIRRINELNSTDSIGYCILRHGLSKQEAIVTEAAVIDLLKSKYINLQRPITNKIRGHHHGVGIMSVDQVIERYSKGMLDLDNLEHDILVINISKSRNLDSIYEAVRKYWRINKNRAKKMDYVLAENDGVIVGVFKAYKWEELDAEELDNEKDKNNPRKYFIGEEVKDPHIVDLYLHKRINKVHGAQNPIRYYYKQK